jgi:sugar lactone lactonase YvrE
MGSIGRCFALSALCGVLATGASGQPVQWTGNGHYYEAVYAPGGINWFQAEAAAESQGGYLATILSADENAFVYSLVAYPQYWQPFSQFNNSEGPWLGGFKLSNTNGPAVGWNWVHGNGPFVYTNWQALEPDNSGGNEDHLVFFNVGSPMGPYWNDISGNFTNVGYVIEWDGTPGSLPPLTIAMQPQSQAVLAGTNVTFKVTVSGAGPFSYQWQFNGTNLNPLGGTITTVAGNGVAGFTDQVGVATNLSLYAPRGVVVDGSGNLFIADQEDDLVQEVKPNGIMMPYAGRDTDFGFPFGVALDGSGNLFVSVLNSDYVYEKGTNGILTITAGVNAGGFAGDGGPATAANIAGPCGVVVDASGNLFIADSGNNRIRKVNSNGIITTVAGGGAGGGTDGIGDGGPATNASLSGPNGVTVDALGNLFIADAGNNVIRKVGTNGVITAIVGNLTAGYSGDNGAATNAELNIPSGVAVDVFGNMFIADSANNVIREVDTNGIITTLAGTGSAAYSGDGGAATNASLWYPWGVGLDGSGNLFIGDTGNQRVRKVVLPGMPTFEIGRADLSKSGDYTVIVSNGSQSVTSSIAALLVLPLEITVEPQNHTLALGANAAFSVSVAGSGPLSYQWLENSTNIPAAVNATATNATLLLPNVQLSQSGNTYSVLVSNAFGSSNSSSAILTVLAPASCFAPPAGLVSWWQGEGNAVDAAGTNSGTLIGGATFTNGEVGRAFSFDGTSQYVMIPNSSGLNPSNQFTIDCWINRGSTGPVVQGVVDGDFYGIEYAPGTYGFYVYMSANNGASWFQTSQSNPGEMTFPAGQWHHLAATYNGTMLQMYLDGQPWGNPVAAFGNVSPMQGGSFFNLGSENGRSCACTGRYYHGLLDEADVFSRALSPSEIQAIYNAGGLGKCIPPPVITSQPQGEAVSVGGTASFSVGAGGGQPLSYQWQVNLTNIPPAANPTATNATLVLTNVQITQSGNNYSVLVGNAAGVTNSGAAVLTVIPPLSILPSTNDLWDISQGSVVTGTSGVDSPLSDVRDMFGGLFSQVETGHTVFANGQPAGFVHYVEWQTPAPVTVNAFNLFAAGDGPAANNQREFAQFVLKAKSDPSATNYDLTLYTLVVSNHPYTYVDPSHQALVSTNIAPVTAQYFRAEFTQYTTGSGYDGPRIVELDGFGPNAPVIVSQPQNERVGAGSTATFSVTASGTTPFTYQWLENSTNIPAAVNPTATNATLTLTNVQVGGSGNTYSVLVSNAQGSTNSANAILTVVPAILPSTADLWDISQGSVVTGTSGINGGSDARDMFGGEFSTVETGNTVFADRQPAGFVHYIQWQTAAPVTVNSFNLFAAGDGSALLNEREFSQFVLKAKSSPATTNYDLTLYTLVVTNHPYTFADPNHQALVSTSIVPVTAQYFRAEFTQYNAGRGFDGPRIVELDGFGPNPPVVLTGPTNETVIAGQTATFSVGASGSVPLTYQWKENSTNIPAAVNPTATNATLVLANVQLGQSGDTYSVLVSNANGATNSLSALLTVLPPGLCVAPPSGLVSWWAAAVNPTDSMGTNNGTLTGGAGFTSGEVGQAFSFDGASGSISIPASSSLNVGSGAGFTIEGWVKPSDLSTPGPLLEWNNGAGGLGTHFWINVPTAIGGNGPGSLFANIVDNGGINHVLSTASNVLFAGTFNHVAVTYDKGSGTTTLFLNGAVVAVQNAGVFTPQTAYNVILGHRASTSYYFKGALDEMSVYNVALSSSEVQSIYNAGSAGKCRNLPPVIVVQPQSQVVPPGSNATFSVVAEGPGPLAYEWLFNGTDLPNIITTIAGNGSTGYSGDGGPATNAAFNQASSMAVDAYGDLFTGDTFNNRIRKVDINGIVTTVAGNGSTGYSGDGGPATNAALNAPNSVAVDRFGNLYFTDCFNQRVREVHTNGIITTVAGNGSIGYSGDSGPAINASLNYPYGAGVDNSGNVFFGDVANNRLRKVDTNGIITTVAGNGTSGYSGDGGPATNARLNYPTGTAVDSSGNLFIVDQNNNCIRKVDANGIITTVAGNGTPGYSGDGGTATNASLNTPNGVTVDAQGNLFISDYSNYRIREVGTDGIITTLAGNGTAGFSGDGGPASNARLNRPAAGGLDSSGNLYFPDDQRIRKVVLNSSPTLTIDDVTASNAGNYSVIVSNPYQSVTSAVAVLTVLAPGSCFSPPAGLISWWPGEHSGLDIAGTNNFNLVGGVTFAAGEVGQAFNIVGPSQYLDLPNNASLNPTNNITVEAWINLRQESGKVPIMIKGGEGSNPIHGYSLEVDNTLGLAFYVYLGHAWVGTVHQPIPTNQWVHVAGIYDGTQVSLYVNGLLVGAPTPASGPIVPSGNDLQIGHDPTPAMPAEVFNGLIDEPSLYGTALSSAQILAIYEAGSGGKCKEPLILTGPLSQIGNLDGSVVLSVNATGSGPLFYQWELGGVPISNATNATLVLTNLQAANGGQYTVVVSNPYGMMTSAPALQTVTPANLAIALYPGITISGIPGLTYGIQYTTNLANNNGWIGLINVTLSESNELWFDLQPATQPQRYYRVLPGPIPIP